jgi:ribosome-binding factor A
MKTSSFSRADRIKSLLHRELAKILSSMKDPRAANVTITEVKISADLRDATVYYSVYDKNSLEQVKQMFESAKGYIRSEIAKKLGMRHAIQLHFVYDKFLEQATNVLFILDSIKDEENKS